MLCTLHMQHNSFLYFCFIPLSWRIPTVENTWYFTKYPSLSYNYILFLWHLSLKTKWTESLLLKDWELEGALGGRASFYSPLRPTLWIPTAKKGKTWTHGVIALLLYLATVWWSRVPCWTLLTYSEAVQLVPEIASVKQQLHLWMQEAMRIYTQNTLLHELHLFIGWRGWTLLCGTSSLILLQTWQRGPVHCS